MVAGRASAGSAERIADGIVARLAYMTEAVLTALIGASGTVLGGVLGTTIPAVLKSKRDRDRFTNVSHSRQSALVGEWGGSGNDSYVEGLGKLLAFTAQARFESKSKKLSAEVNLIAPDPSQNAALRLEGGFYDDDYVQFSYRSKNPIRKQMGVVVLKLSETGDSLAGHYAGFSPLRGRFVVGEIHLKKLV